MLPSRTYLVRSFLVAVLIAFLGQTPARPQSSSGEVPPPTIRVSTHLVLVDVVVTDKQGKPITGLKPEDFVVEENGKAQKISTFTASVENAPAPALPPGIYSNRPEYRSPGGPITVMLLDSLNTEFKDQAYAKTQMLKFVQQNYKPGQRMAVFTLTGGLNVLQDFTSDPQVLYSALQRFRPLQQNYGVANGTPPEGPAAPNDAAVTPINDNLATLPPAVAAQISVVQAALQSFADAEAAYARDQRATLTLTALNSLSRILGGLPGRKSIIWVTGDLPFSLIPENRTVTDAELAENLPSLNTRRVGEHAAGNYEATFRSLHAEDIRETAARLSSAQVAIYPVDARGLTISTGTDSQEQMREMARDTGGRAYVNQNEIKIGVERAFQDASATYTVGYYPDNKKYDGKYRSIKIKVKHDGADVQARNGYYAIDPSQVKGYKPENEVSSAMHDVVPATQVAFTARVVPPSANSAKGKLGIDYLVDASTLSAEDASGGKRLNILFYATAFGPDGKVVANGSKKVDQTFDAQTYQTIMQKGMLLHMDVDAPPANSRLHLAVQDNKTGLVGTISAPVLQ